MDISIVIPAYEESDKIAADIRAASEFISNNDFTGEIIVVDDGSTDGTAEAAQSCEKSLPEGVSFIIITYERNRGKGYAVKEGIAKSKGEYVMFADSGCCVPYDFALEGLKLLKAGMCDIAHGSRKMESSKIKKGQSFYRRICAKLFRGFLVFFMGIPSDLTDTQCGFKVYRGDAARDIYSKCLSQGFAFDVETIKLALKNNYKVKEFGVQWRCDRDSRLQPALHLLNILSELIRIKFKHR